MPALYPSRAGGIDNLAPTAPVIISAEAADDGESVTVLFGRSVDDADGFQAASGDFTSGGTFVSSNNVAGYLVRRADGIDFPVVDGGADALAVVDPTVEPGQTYVYQAVAFDDAGNEGVSAAISVDVGEDVLPPVPPVENLKWVIDRPSITISWDLPDPVEGVEIASMNLVFTYIGSEGEFEPIAFELGPIEIDVTYSVDDFYGDGKYELALQLVAADGRESEASVAVLEVLAPERIAAAVTFQATEEEANAIVSDEVLLADFTTAFTRATAELLGISIDRVVVNSVDVGSLEVLFELLPPEDPEEEDAVTAEEAFVALETAVEAEPETYAESVNEEAAAENSELVIELASPVVAEIKQVSIALGEGFTGDLLSTTRTVTNNLDVEDTITIELTGESFSVSTDALTLAAGASGDFEINYSSDVLGDAEGTVSVSTSDSENPGEEITVSASIVARPPVIVVDDTPIAFGELAVGLSDSQSLTIANDGEADLNVTLLILGTGFQATTATIAVGGGSSVDVDITFAPEEGGDAVATLVVSSNDPEQASVLIDLSGTGVAPIPADIDLIGTEFNFGGVPVDDTATRTMVVRNVGEEALTGEISIAGDAQFSIDAAGAFTLDPSESQGVEISFTPDAEADFAATITVTSDDEDEPELTVELSGAGVAGEEICRDNDNPLVIRVSDFANRDGSINFFDFLAFADRFNASAGQDLYDVTFDISPPGDPDGTINFFDFFAFADDFGSFCTYSILGADIGFSAELDVDQQVPDPVITDASGTATVTLNGDQTEVTYSVSYTGLSGAPTNAHFHVGAAGEGGGVQHGIGDNIVDNGDGSGTIDGTWAVTADDLALLGPGNLYLNIHTDANPAGEIRGQVIGD